MAKPEFTIIIPVYNEAKTIRDSLARFESYMKKQNHTYKIMIFDDASTDHLEPAISNHLQEQMEVIRNADRIGRGASLNKSIKLAETNIVLYLDADLSFELDIIPELVNAIKSGAIVATGSRLLPDSKTKRSPVRLVSSRLYNSMVRSVLGSRIHDHQCGCKAFDRNKIIPLLSETKARHWFWDTEILVLAQKKGMKVIELPITWWEGRYSSVNMMKDAPTMFLKILELKKRLST